MPRSKAWTASPTSPPASAAISTSACDELGQPAGRSPGWIGNQQQSDIRLDRAQVGAVREDVQVAGNLGQILLGHILRVDELDRENAAAGQRFGQRAALPIPDVAAIVPVEARELERFAVELLDLGEVAANANAV